MKAPFKSSPKLPHSKKTLNSLDTSLIIVKDIQNLLSNDRTKTNETLQFSLSFYNLENDIPTSHAIQSLKLLKEQSPEKITTKFHEKDISPVNLWGKFLKIWILRTSKSAKANSHHITQMSRDYKPKDLRKHWKMIKAATSCSRNRKKTCWTKVILNLRGEY